MADLFDPWTKLVRVVVLGRVFEVPENNILLRQLQYVAEDIGTGRYCWNAECRYCEIQVERPGGTASYPGLACRLQGTEGMKLTKIATEIRYNMTEALASAPKEDDSGEPPSTASESAE